MPGVEVHQRAPGDRLIVTAEDAGTMSASENILEMHRLPGVISAALTYHSFEDLPEADAVAGSASPHTRSSAKLETRP
jgi:nitrate reductase NapD